MGSKTTVNGLACEKIESTVAHQKRTVPVSSRANCSFGDQTRTFSFVQVVRGVLLAENRSEADATT